MARQGGILKIKGTIGGMTFYKSQDGHLVREKGGVSGERIANDPAFIRTRENGAEFGAAGTAGKMMRDALRALMMNAADNRVTSRITKLMTDILKLDLTSERGKRTPALGLQTVAGKASLNGFNFNINAILSSILFKAFTVDTGTGVIGFTNLIPINDLAFPAGATDVRISGGFAVVDFESGAFELEQDSTPITPINAAPLTFNLTPPAIPTLVGIKMILLKVEFFQSVNGSPYSLKNGAYNSLSIIEVA